MKEKISQLLDSVYELEGLLHLALSRDEIPEKLPELIRRKVLELSEKISDDVPIPESLPSAETEPQDDDSPLYEYSMEDDEYEGEDTEKELKEEEVEKEGKPVQGMQRQATTPSYSLNDRFLFIRELFGGNTREFNRAMESVASFDSYEEAESFFIDELNLDETSETATRFLEIIEEYFRSR